MYGTPPDLIGWLHPGLHTAKSLIHGQGLFGHNPLAAGTAVVRFGGTLFLRTARNDPAAVVPGSVVGLGEDVLLAEPVGREKDPSDYINHCCTPNLGMLDAITLVTIRNIPACEELTCDYAYWENDPAYRMKSPCHCRSPSCRGTITGMDWLQSAELSHLERWSAPFIRRRILRPHF